METLTVASKLPGKLSVRHPKKGRSSAIIINGTAIPRRALRENEEIPFIRNGYAYTYDVPAEDFLAWVDVMKEVPFIKEHMVIYFAKQTDVDAKTKEYKSLKTGLEPMPQSGPGIQKMRV